MLEPHTLKGQSTQRESGLAEELNRFRNSSIQRNYTYFAEFLDSDLADLIKPHQILAISLPFPVFTKQVVGESFYPIGYAQQKNDGYEVRMHILETGNGHVRTLIDRLASRIRKPNGLYNPPNQQKILGTSLKILDYSGRVSDRYVYQNMLYLTSEEISFTYEGSEAVKINITFHVDDIRRMGVDNSQV